MKRKLFIGSSKEGLEFAKQLKEKLDNEFVDFLQCTVWTDGEIFSSNKGTLEALVKAARRFDYGVLIATKDDIREMRDNISNIPRDNVMFEMGMFLGSLGLTRAFLLAEKHNTLPTDYNGVTVPTFEREVDGSLEEAIEKIISAINNTKKSYNLKPVPSAALALGYFDNFILPMCSETIQKNTNFELKVLLPNSLESISAETTIYNLRNSSKEISVYEDGKRPFVNNLLENPSIYWDIPTTLTTLNKLINLVNPSLEIGIQADKQDWLDHELRNFKGTIEVLVETSSVCQNKVFVSYL